jgi:anti-sigma factor RsiW
VTCDGARDLFSALVDDALSAEERRDLDAHLAGCADCRRELQAFRGTVALVRSAGPVRAPMGFVDRVLPGPGPRRGTAVLPAGSFCHWA